MPDRRVAPAAAGVLLVHLALILLLDGSWKVQRSVAPTPRVTLRLIPMVMPPEPTPKSAAAPSLPTLRATASARPPRKPAPIIANDARGAPPVATATAITPPAPAASSPDAPSSLMDAEATRRAIRASARTPSLGDQLAQSREEPRRLGANDRLANDVRDAGKGDCLKGKYAGAGMGLLSLPFLAAAALSGNCAK